VNAQPEASPATANGGATYIADVVANMQTILDAIPGIKSDDLLPEECGGFLAPYKPDMYNIRWADAGSTGKMHYQ
jgi:hypothetical protein